jgi:hypothetical protein
VQPGSAVFENRDKDLPGSQSGRVNAAEFVQSRCIFPAPETASGAIFLAVYRVHAVAVSTHASGSR